MRRFVLILQFLTRITIAKNLPYDKEFKKGIVYFPLVGLVIGLILAGAYRLFALLFLNNIVGILLLALYVFLTGGLHLDGLGDTFDGVYSNQNKERVLEIMKDSRLGTNGVLIIFFSLMVKTFGIMTILDHNMITGLILIPVFGRLALVYGSYKAKYAREEGLGHIFIGKITSQEVFYTTLITGVITLIHKESLVFIGITVAFSYLYKRHIEKSIDGMTGDTLGALCELTEVMYILYLLAIVNISLF
ncbi:MAG: adenosylcobinamide-GDP ribazoletransferase [Clostridiaceae bacterium]|nr:adenosylcobinamide-GDP ribazoletransferase [Clostridiaceae bacterium]